MLKKKDCDGIDYTVRCVILGIEQKEEVDYLKWHDYVNEALSCLEKDKLYWIHLPCSGGYYDQDEEIITIWEYIKYAYFQAMNDESIKKELTRKKNA